MAQLVCENDPLNTLRQIAVEHNELATRVHHEEALARQRVLTHRPLHDLDLHCITDLIQIVCLVMTYLSKHPEEKNKSLIARETGVDRSTVRKYYSEFIRLHETTK